MKNKTNWKPTKFVYRKNKYRATQDQQELMIASRFIADIVASNYEKLFPKYAFGKLLDIGCGDVPFYQMYQQHITNNICVDWAKNNYVDVVHDISKNLPFDDNSFETILLSDVLEHTPNPTVLIGEIHRILKKNGRLLMNTPFYYHIHAAPYDYYRYTEFALIKFLEESNFEILEKKVIGGSVEVFADFFTKHIQYVPFLGKPITLFTHFIVRLISATKIGKKISVKTGSNFPLGYIFVAEKK